MRLGEVVPGYYLQKLGLEGKGLREPRGPERVGGGVPVFVVGGQAGVEVGGETHHVEFVVGEDGFGGC